jgi:salicylate hydroxylase
MASEQQGGKDEFGLHFWVPPRQKGVSDDDRWGGGVDLDEMRRQLGPCEPRYN